MEMLFIENIFSHEINFYRLNIQITCFLHKVISCLPVSTMTYQCVVIQLYGPRANPANKVTKVGVPRVLKPGVSNDYPLIKL